VSFAVDQKYYEVAPPDSLAERLVISARARIFEDFMARMRPTSSERVLDVGVSDVINDAANMLERAYPHSRNITACGLGEGREFRQAFPEVEYVHIKPNVALPFPDKTFAVATANAVLEHVGSFDNQVLFIGELCRVASRVFVSVPNRLFPIEHHTALPVAHYQRHLFRAACRVAGKSEWARRENLIFMTRKRLWQLAAPFKGKSAVVGYTGLLLGPFSSNLFLALY
jgi:ubiquinone/menaquinone biosynthesis C-methylase UbiE